MHTQHKHSKVFSVELFPPKTPAGEENLAVALDPLAALGPAFFSVTFGAGGTWPARRHRAHRRAGGAAHGPRWRDRPLAGR